ncbi:MAG: head GIN domain-containing protein [Salibacteraceae bacterium]
MKRIITLSTAIALGALTISSCSKDKWGCKRANGNMTTETRMVEDFTQVHLEGSGDIVFHQIDSENDERIIVEASDNVMDRIETKVKRGKLTIDNDCIRGTKNDMKFDIYVMDLSKVSISGSGSAITDGNFDVTGNLDFNISGSGDIDFSTNAKDINIDISGSGNVDLNGTCEDIDVKISGSGELNAFSMEANDCYVDISGSGSCRVFTNGLLDVSISGSGDVIYDGTPITVNTDTQGSGDVRRR